MRDIKIYRKLCEIGFSELVKIYWDNDSNYTLRCAHANMRMGNITYTEYQEIEEVLL